MENISAYVYSPKISVAILGIVVGFGVLSSRKNDLQHSKNDLQHNKNNLQHSKNDLQHSKNNLQHSKNNLQHNKNDLQHSKNNLQHSKNDLSSYRYGYLYKIILHLQHYLIKKKGGFYAKPGNKKRDFKN